ncbi:MAG: hypothetical protein JO329_22005 [Planctomycetaceae bacterium]|nr:hypothetical protein [Planctomycetaceae bacterium]
MRQGQVKHALKTALCCCVASLVSFYFYVPYGQLAPVFAFMIMALGMPSPRLNALLVQLTLVFSAIVSSILVLVFHAAPPIFLVFNLLWIFTCLLFTNWFSLPANMGAMISTIGIYVFFDGTVGETLAFYWYYALNWFVGGLVVVVIHTLLWPMNVQTVFLERLAAAYSFLEEDCRKLARWLHTGEPPPAEPSRLEWAPFRPLQQLLAPELRQARDTTNPFARMILACRALNLRLWFFGQAIAPAMPTAQPLEARLQLATHLDQCAEQLHALLESALFKKQVRFLDLGWFGEREEGEVTEPPAPPREDTPTGMEVLLARDIPQSILHRLTQDLQTVTSCQHAILTGMPGGMMGELASLSPVTIGTRLIDDKSLRAATKLALLALLLLGEEALLNFPGGSQVAFFAVFFASTGNLGRQNKTDLVGLFGLLLAIGYGILAAVLTSPLEGFPLLLVLVFLGEFLAMLVYQRLPRYRAAGQQAALGLPFAYLATPGLEWGSFPTAWTRFGGLAVTGFTAVVTHAYLWPVLPMRQLRALFAGALRDTAESLGRLFAGPPRSLWGGSPPSLGETVTRARDLLDDARYLPGPDHADPAYLGILEYFQQIDGYLDYVHFLLSLEPEHALREQFFQVVSDYAQEAQLAMERVAQQFQQNPRRAVRLGAVHWDSDASERWDRASPTVGEVAEGAIDPTRPALIAHCLDQIARATERISGTAHEINLRNKDL